MTTFFKPTSYRLANGKWVPQYTKIIQSGALTNTQNNSWNKQFDSKQEADEYANSFCLRKGYKLVVN